MNFRSPHIEQLAAPTRSGAHIVTYDGKAFSYTPDGPFAAEVALGLVPWRRLLERLSDFDYLLLRLGDAQALVDNPLLLLNSRMVNAWHSVNWRSFAQVVWGGTPLRPHAGTRLFKAYFQHVPSRREYEHAYSLLRPHGFHPVSYYPYQEPFVEFALHEGAKPPRITYDEAVLLR